MPASKKKPAAKVAPKTAVAAAARSYEDILYEVKDQVAWVTINRPRVLNAFREMRRTGSPEAAFASTSSPRPYSPR